MIRISFVCLGNICRSPMAEGVFKNMARQAGLADQFQVESAGLGSWHVGEPPDPRATRAAAAHGVRLDSTAQQFRPKDFDRFDRVIALDEEIAADLRRMAPGPVERAKVRLMRDYDPHVADDLNVPDPYYGGPEGFEHVYQIVERSCRALLQELKGELERAA